MRLTILLGLAAALVGMNPARAADEAVCKPLSESLAGWMKEGAYYDAGAFVDRANAQTKATLLQSSLLMAQITIQQMAAANCPIPSAPLTTKIYFAEAFECVTAQLQAQAREKCDRTKWSGNK